MIIIDGYNVIHKWKSLVEFINKMELARTRLLEILSNYQGYVDEDILVVFDSKLDDVSYSNDLYPNLEIVFSSNTQSADVYIERYVYSHSNPSCIRVVTGDRLSQMTVSHKNVIIEEPEKFEEEVNRICYKRGV